MNIYASPGQRNGAQRADAGADGDAQPHEIKYRQDAAGYVAAMLTELRQIAGKAGFEKLVKSLDAAYYDAYGALDGKSRNADPSPPARLASASTEKTSIPVEPNAG